MLAHVSKKIRKSKQKSRKLEKSERKPFWTLAVTSQCRIRVGNGVWPLGKALRESSTSKP
jgi:hypothetical protein